MKRSQFLKELSDWGHVIQVSVLFEDKNNVEREKIIWCDGWGYFRKDIIAGPTIPIRVWRLAKTYGYKICIKSSYLNRNEIYYI